MSLAVIYSMKRLKRGSHNHALLANIVHRWTIFV